MTLRLTAGRVVALAAAMCLILAGCAGSGSSDEPEALERRTIAFLRAVRSSQPENQAAFIEELGRAGRRSGENLELIAESLDEVHPDEGSTRAAVEGWAKQGVDLIVALSTMSARVAAEAAPDTNVLFLVNDPVSTGLVEDVRRPSRNLTGVTFHVPADRTLEVTRRAFPTVERIGVVYPPADPAAAALATEATAAAATLRVDMVAATFTGDADGAAAVESLRTQGVGAIWVLNSPTSVRYIQPITAAATAAGLPLIANTKIADSVVTLQPDGTELYRQLARQALQLFDGVAIADIPVENPAKFVLEVDLAVAARLGLSVPEDFVQQADVVNR